MKIYHGTSATIGRKAMNEELRPRDSTGKSNWKHTVESHSELIYLTTAYALYYAIQAVKETKRAKFAILDIETDLLDETKMRPDEDFIEQPTSRDQDNNADIVGKTMNERKEYIRNHIDEFANSWRLSVLHLGNCAHKGVIERTTITNSDRRGWGCYSRQNGLFAI